ncbi:MAG: hypothetical protein NT033_07610, partial [Candidatus Omnitrophica bacterium]|nr:hypothetical protein [Candidatus Omnitrophota bacterium]
MEAELEKSKSMDLGQNYDFEAMIKPIEDKLKEIAKIKKGEAVEQIEGLGALEDSSLETGINYLISQGSLVTDEVAKEKLAQAIESLKNIKNGLEIIKGLFNLQDAKLADKREIVKKLLDTYIKLLTEDLSVLDAQSQKEKDSTRRGKIKAEKEKLSRDIARLQKIQGALELTEDKEYTDASYPNGTDRLIGSLEVEIAKPDTVDSKETVGIIQIINACKGRLAATTSDKAILAARKSLVEFARGEHKKDIEKQLKDKTEAVGKHLEQAEKLVEFKNKGTKEDFGTVSSKSLEDQQARMLAAYEHYRRTFRPDLPELATADINILAVAIKLVFNFDVTVDNNNFRDNLCKFLFLMSKGAEGKVEFSKLTFADWNQPFKKLKFDIEKVVREKAALRDSQNESNLEKNSAKLVLDKLIEQFNKFKAELTKLDTYDKRMKFFSENKKDVEDIAQFAKQLVLANEQEIEEIVKIIASFAEFIEGLPVKEVFGIERKQAAKEIIGFVLKARNRNKAKISFTKLLNKLGKKVFIYEVIATNLVELAYSGSKASFIIRDSKG